MSSNINISPVRFIPYWEEAALCAQIDPALFFGAENEQTKDKRKRISLAKAVCANCPVILNCLQQAVDTNDMHAIMGGTTPEERGHSGNWTGKRITSWSIQTILRNRRKEATNV